MLPFMILLLMLYMVPGNSFPQRNNPKNPNFDSNFDFDSYLEHFTENPLDQTINNHLRFAPNQDYRYIPLLGERPDYIPPILPEGHFPHSNIPRRSVVKQRAWHSSYQDGNFPRPVMQHATKGIRPQVSMQNHREWNHQRTNPHLKMEDFGHHEDPVVVEAFFKNGKHEINRDHKASIVDEPSRGKPVFIKEHSVNHVTKPIINEDHYDTPEVVEALVKKWKPVSINPAHKQPIRIDSIKNKHETYPKDYEEPVVVEALIKKAPPHSKRHSHKKPILNHGKRPIVKHDQKHRIKTTAIPVPSSYSEDYDTPVVVEAFTKEKLPVSNIRHGHNKPIKAVHVGKEKNPIHQPDRKPIVTSYPEDYEAPVVEVLSKKESVAASPVVKKYLNYPIVEPVGKPAMPSYPDNYDLPVVVETFTRKGMVHKKGHGHKKPIEAEPVKKHEKNPIIEPEEKPSMPSYTDDYDLPMVVEALSKKGTVHKKGHGHKIIIEKQVVKKHEKNPIVEPVEKPIMPTYTDNYDLPVVIEALTKKGTVHKKGHGHKLIIEKQVVKKHEKNPIEPEEKPAMPSYTDGYDLPVVVETFTRKGMVHKKGHDHKKPIEVEHVFKKHEKNPIIEPEEKPDMSSYTDNYDLPVVVEALTKKGTVHKNEHGYMKPIKEKQVVKKHEKNPIVEPVRKPGMPSYLDNYDLPVVVETFTRKEMVHKKGHGHKKPIEAEHVKKHEKNPIIEPEEKPGMPSYTDDYDLPVVVEALTKKGAVHNKEHGHKAIEVELVVEKRDEKNPIVKPVKSSYTKDYEAPVVVETWASKGSAHNKENSHNQRVEQSEMEPVLEKQERSKKPEENLPIQAYTDYTSITINPFNHKSKDSEYEDSVDMEDPISNDYRVQHGHKQVVERPPMKDNIVKKTVNYERLQKEPIYQRNTEGLKISKDEVGWPKGQFEESEIKRFKRELESDHEDDYDFPIVEEVVKKNAGVVDEPAYVDKPTDSLDDYDYDLPVVIEVQTKNSQTTSHKKQSLQDPKDREYEYDLPAVIEVQTKNPKVDSLRKPDFMKPADHEYDYDLPVVIEVQTKKIATSHKNPEFVEPSDREDYYEPSEWDQTSYEKDEKLIEIVKKPSKINQDNYHEALDIKVSTGKRGTKKHGHKHAEKKTAKGKPNVGTKPSREPIVITKYEKLVDVHGQNKKHKNHQQYLPTHGKYNVGEDGYERPVDKDTDVNMHGYKRPGDYFDEDYSVTEDKPIPGNFEPMDISDTEVVLDSISIHRESPEGREIPVLDVLAVENHASETDTGVKVMAFNKENGNVNVINIGHEDSNHRIEDFSDSGSGVDLDERSSVPRSFLPMNSNAWSFMTLIQAQERQKFKHCLTPKNETGNCMPIQMCPIPNAGGTIDDFLRNVCIIDEVFIGICCPEFPVESVRVDWGQLGNSNPEPLIDEQESREPLECGRLPSLFRSEDSWPWMAPLISTASDRVFCGGALINEQYVLTAAHCTSRIPRNRILVRLGSAGSQTGAVELAVIEIKRHAQYNPKTMQNDIALLKLSRRVPLGNFRRLVCIPDGDVDDSVGETAVLRWQANSGSEVESLPVISNQECQNRLGTLIGDSVLCTEPRNEETTCNADSGAPLVVSANGKFNIIGVLTWNRNDCDGRFPSVFTRISSYRKWIRNHAN